MANKHRAEYEFEVKDRKYVLHGTFESMSDIEAESGTTLYDIMFNCQKNTLSLRHTTAVIWGGMKGAGKEMSFEKVGEMICEAGPSNFLIPIYGFVLLCLSGGGEKKTKPLPRKNVKNSGKKE